MIVDDEGYIENVLDDERFYDNFLHDLFDDFNFKHKRILHKNFVDYKHEIFAKEFSKLEEILLNGDYAYFKVMLNLDIKPASDKISKEIKSLVSPFQFFIEDIVSERIKVSNEVKEYVLKNYNKLLPKEYIHYIKFDLNDENFPNSFLKSVNKIDSVVFELFKMNDEVLDKFRDYLQEYMFPESFIEMLKQYFKDSPEEFVVRVRRAYPAIFTVRYMYIPGLIKPGNYLASVSLKEDYYVYYIPKLKIFYYFPFKSEDYDTILEFFGEPDFEASLCVDEDNVSTLEYFYNGIWRRSRLMYKIEPLKKEYVNLVMYYE